MKKEDLFWDWFKVNEAKFFFLNQINDNDEKERILDDLLCHLHEYCDQLFFEIGGHPDERQDLIITADGNSSFFNTVETLVNHAPALSHWNIVAFKPAIGSGIIEYNSLKLDSDAIYFMPLSSKASTKIGLRVYVMGYNINNQKDFLTAIHLLLDNLLGEKSTALDIGHVEVENLTTISQKDELIEFVKLPRYINGKNQDRRLNFGGALSK